MQDMAGVGGSLLEGYWSTFWNFRPNLKTESETNLVHIPAYSIVKQISYIMYVVFIKTNGRQRVVPSTIDM